MRFGFHISIAGGFSRVVERAKLRGCETIQLFSRNPRGWSQTDIDPDDLASFKKQMRDAEIFPLVVHLPYLPNLASKASRFYEKSVRVLADDLRRAELLSAAYLVIHMGSRLGADEQEAVHTLADSVGQVFLEIQNRVVLLLENTAGQGTQIGWRFSQIGEVIGRVVGEDRVGVCLDTAHAYGAGYDLSRMKGLDDTLRELDRFVGLKKVHLVHLNDTRVALGSHKDRHWHIGKGRIGIEGFRSIVSDSRLNRLPGIMETPQKDVQHDLMNMATIRGLVKAYRKPGSG